MSNIANVIGWKFNHQEGMVTVNGVITEFPNGIPSAEDPTIGDQLDALWKGGDDQAAMKIIVDKVKTDNPKPE